MAGKDKKPDPVPQRDAKGRFPKGVSGNPAGPRKQDHKLRELARAYTEQGVLMLWELATTAKSEAVRLGALREMFDRGWGKAVLPIISKALDDQSEKELLETIGFEPTDEQLVAALRALESARPAGTA